MGYLTEGYTVYRGVGGVLRAVAADEEVVTKVFVTQALIDASKAARVGRIERANSELSKQVYALSTERDALKTEVSDLKDLLKQTLEYAVSGGEPRYKIRPEMGKRTLHFTLGGAPHLNIEILPALTGDAKRVVVWAPAPPDPDANVKARLSLAFPSRSGASALQQIRAVGLDITLKSQGKGETVNPFAPSLKLVS